jgi:hypothetical protein
MIPVTVRRVLLAEHRVDFRRQMTGLLAEAYRIGADPYDGDCVVFIRKDRTQIRALVGDDYGLYLVSRRFEGSRLRALLKFAEEPSAKVVSTFTVGGAGCRLTVVQARGASMWGDR